MIDSLETKKFLFLIFDHTMYNNFPKIIVCGSFIIMIKRDEGKKFNIPKGLEHC
jgi:hypothetical protein